MATSADGTTVTRNVMPSAGAEGRMRELYENSAEVVFRFLMRLTFGQRQLAEDLLQETYLRAWRKLDQLPADPASALPWLYTVARRVAIDAARARAARPVEVGTSDILAVPTADGLAEHVVDSRTVRAALSKLSDQHREVLFEVYFRDEAPCGRRAAARRPAGHHSLPDVLCASVARCADRRRPQRTRRKTGSVPRGHSTRRPSTRPKQALNAR